MKYFQLFISAIFFFFASLQLNDPSPVIWVSAYAFVGIAFFLTSFEMKQVYFGYALLTGLAICVFGIALLVPGFIQWMEAGAPNPFATWGETTPLLTMVREFVGVILCAIGLGYNMHLFVLRTQEQEDKRSEEAVIFIVNS